METIYLGIVIFLFLLAIFDLTVGVSNDAVNFLNSAIGSKVARFKTIIIIAAVGVFVGAITSNGMMEIARHGIFKPEAFYFEELMAIFLGVMVTDVVMLDVFNSLGMPTSTTVSMIFELLGGTFALSIYKIASDTTGTITLDHLVNGDKALQVIIAIFLSVAIAFIFGCIVQYISRLIFSFNYKKNLKWKIGLFGGIAITAIIYFILIKGVKKADFMTPEIKSWIATHTWLIVGGCGLFFTLLMQLLHSFKVNVFKIIILLGTFALALAFAGNDLVNFVGVPLAGFSSYLDFTSTSGADVATHTMEALNSPANTSPIFLILAGVIMVLSLAFSKKAQKVVKTSVDLSRQDEGEEMFGSSSLARSIVRHSQNLALAVSNATPTRLKNWIESRFNTEEAILENNAAFDLVRASVNLVLASLLIVLGTSLTLPLSTTYVTFMVVMGTSLADRAWGRESAVFRITGVISVIGGWFLTAGIAFVACGLVTYFMFIGGPIVMFLMILLATFMVVKSHIKYQKTKAASKEDELFAEMLAAKEENEIWKKLTQHIYQHQANALQSAGGSLKEISEAFLQENFRKLRKLDTELTRKGEALVKLRRKELVGFRRISPEKALTVTTWYHLLINQTIQINYCLRRMGTSCKNHVGNNFNVLPDKMKEEFLILRNRLVDAIEAVEQGILSNDFSKRSELSELKSEIAEIRKKQMNRIQQDTAEHLKVSLVYLNILQEAQALVSALRQLLRAARNMNKE